MPEPAKEADITISGKSLTIGQSMAIRLAVSSEFSQVERNPTHLGEDERGRLMCEAYRQRLLEVIAMLMKAMAR